MSDGAVALTDVQDLGLYAEPCESGFLLAGRPHREHEGVPQWFADRQRAAWTTFESLPWPRRTDEAWRFSDLKRLDISTIRQPLPVGGEEREQLIERSVRLQETAGRMIFGNDQLLDRRLLSEELTRKGVIWKPLHTALIEHGDLFRQHFMANPTPLGSARFSALHESYVRSGTFLYVPRGIEVELPLEVFHWLGGDGGSTFPHTLLIAEENSKVTLVDYFESADRTGSGFACGVNDLIVGAGAKVTYVCVQNWNEQTVAVQMNSTIVGRSAEAIGLNLNLGASFARLEGFSRLVGEGGRSDMLAVTVAGGTQEFDQRTLQDHIRPHTASDLLYKNALNGKARTIFAGLIRVEPQAQHTNAYQKVRNLLLSDEAEADSMPGLEIMANEVRCSHGATSGRIDEEELFYLRSRGIPSLLSQQLIARGFLHEVFERLRNELVADQLSDLVAGKFAALEKT